MNSIERLFIDKEQAIKRMNSLGKERTPFFFLTDFGTERCLVEKPMIYLQTSYSSSSQDTPTPADKSRTKCLERLSGKLIPNHSTRTKIIRQSAKQHPRRQLLSD